MKMLCDSILTNSAKISFAWPSTISFLLLNEAYFCVKPGNCAEISTESLESVQTAQKFSAPKYDKVLDFCLLVNAENLGR